MATKKDLTLLATIVAAMSNADTPYLMGTVASVKALTAEGLVETNPDIADGDKVAIRATEKGLTLNNEQNANSTAAATAGATDAAKPKLAIIKGAVLPQGRTSPESDYPFDDMEPGDSFFLPNTDAKPNVAKSIASTVSAATKRYAVDIPGQTRVNRKGATVQATKNTRVFAVKAVKKGVAYGEFTPDADGALISRVDTAA